MMNNFIPVLKYVMITIRHKFFVFIAGIKIKTSIWLLIVHDFSKFSLHELPHYGRQFYGSGDDSEGFSRAWNHHQKINPHHWEYWVMVTGHKKGGFADGTPLSMPEKYIREMVADWIGASRAYEGKWPTKENWKWFSDNFNKIKLHAQTRTRIIELLNDFFDRK